MNDTFEVSEHQNPGWDMKALAQKKAEEMELFLNDLNREGFLASSLPNWLKQVFNNGRALPLPIAPDLLDLRLDWQGTGWGYETVHLFPMITKEDVLLKLEELFAQGNNGGIMLEKMTGDQLAAAGIDYQPVEVPLSNAFGYVYGNGYIGFNGNRLQYPAQGTQATNPADGRDYIFYSRGGGPGVTGFWVTPRIYERLTTF